MSKNDIKYVKKLIKLILKVKIDEGTKKFVKWYIDFYKSS